MREVYRDLSSLIFNTAATQSAKARRELVFDSVHESTPRSIECPPLKSNINMPYRGNGTEGWLRFLWLLFAEAVFRFRANAAV